MFAPERRSPVEYLVFALAAVLLAVLGYQAVRRGLPELLGRRADSAAPVVHYQVVQPEPAPAPDAVGFVAPVKVTGKADKAGIRPISVPEPPR